MKKQRQLLKDSSAKTDDTTLVKKAERLMEKEKEWKEHLAQLYFLEETRIMMLRRMRMTDANSLNEMSDRSALLVLLQRVKAKLVRLECFLIEVGFH